jgi:hypothetical protein
MKKIDHHDVVAAHALAHESARIGFVGAHRRGVEAEMPLRHARRHRIDVDHFDRSAPARERHRHHARTEPEHERRAHPGAIRLREPFQPVRVERRRAMGRIDAVLRETVLEVDADVAIAARLGLAA